MMRKRANNGSFPPPVLGEELLLKEWLPLVSKLVTRFYNKHKHINDVMSWDDLYSEGQIGLLRGIRLYDINKNVPKQNYYSICIMSQMNNAYKKHGEFIHHTKDHCDMQLKLYNDTPQKILEIVDEEKDDNLLNLNNYFKEEEVDILVFNKLYIYKKYPNIDYVKVLGEACKKLEMFIEELNINN